MWIPSLYWARLFLPRLHPLLEFSPSVVHTLPWPWSLDLNHLKGFCNLVEKCMSTIVDFQLYDSPESIYQYIVDGNIVTHGDCSRFPNVIKSGIPMSRSLCALWPGLVEVSHPLGILPIRCLSTWSWLAFTDSQALISLLVTSWILMYFCHASPPVALNGEWSGFCWYLHSFRRTYAGL